MGDAPTIPPGWPDTFSLIHRDSVGSTNDEARKLAITGAKDGIVIWADTQTNGRGRRGREWESPVGNLYFSIVLRPEKPLSEAAMISLIAAISLSDALRAVLPDDVDLLHKWPNDILVDGAKIAGILLEASSGGASKLVEWIVLGCGVNIVSHPKNTVYPATDLGCYPLKPTAGDILTLFVQKFSYWRALWLEDGVAPIRSAWLHRAKGLGERVTVRTGAREIQGVFHDLDVDGALMLSNSDGVIERVTAGDVFFGSA
ncbi:MAG: BirA family biotin operon repressor/biotin-[acetyl-CoA-carboxylase] ligase [Alphaproteobacteria bacterium]|jgi:BirA family biotin operon repressor/biotin-[acetyl-CoA-carboxylase] ligase